MKRKDEVFVVFNTDKGGESTTGKDSGDGKNKGQLRFDVDNCGIRTLKYVVVSRDTTYNHRSEEFVRNCYVIVMKGRRGRKYSRVGVGSLHQTIIFLEGAGVLASVVQLSRFVGLEHDVYVTEEVPERGVILDKEIPHPQPNVRTMHNSLELQEVDLQNLRASACKSLPIKIRRLL